MSGPVGTALKVAVSLALLALLATRIDVGETLRAMSTARTSGLAIALALFVGSNVLGAIQWRALLQASGLSVSLARSLAYYFQGSFFGLFLPASVGADVSRVVDTSRHTGRTEGAIAATVMDRLVGFYSMSLMAVAGLLVHPDDLPALPILLPILGFACVNAAIAGALFSPAASRMLGRMARRVPRPAIRDALITLVDSLHSLGRRRGLVGGLLLLSLFVQVMRIGVHVQVAGSMGIELPLREFFVIIPVLAVLVALPISFGGIGVRESAAAELFGHVGVTPTDAVAMQVIAFALSILASLPGWFIFVGRAARRRGGGRS